MSRGMSLQPREFFSGLLNHFPPAQKHFYVMPGNDGRKKRFYKNAEVFRRRKSACHRNGISRQYSNFVDNGARSGFRSAFRS
jgi:hypothetical protein